MLCVTLKGHDPVLSVFYQQIKLSFRAIQSHIYYYNYSSYVDSGWPLTGMYKKHWCKMTIHSGSYSHMSSFGLPGWCPWWSFDCSLELSALVSIPLHSAPAAHLQTLASTLPGTLHQQWHPVPQTHSLDLVLVSLVKLPLFYAEDPIRWFDQVPPFWWCRSLLAVRQYQSTDSCTPPCPAKWHAHWSHISRLVVFLQGVWQWCSLALCTTSKECDPMIGIFYQQWHNSSWV